MSDREWFFKKLDDYARKQYQCFVAEMFPSKDQAEYIICFRPVDVVRDSSEQYACRYVSIAVADVDAAHQEDRLTDSISEKLVNALESLRPNR